MRNKRQRPGAGGSADGAQDSRWIRVNDLSLPRDRADEDRNLTRAEAKVVALELFNTDSPAVVELLLLAHNQDADTLKRYAANMALEWFDPEVELPTPAHLEEPPALRAIRWCIYAYDPEARKQAAAAAVFHLQRWGQ